MKKQWNSVFNRNSDFNIPYVIMIHASSSSSRCILFLLLLSLLPVVLSSNGWPITVKHSRPYSQEHPSSVLANWHSNTANRLVTAKPANKGELGTSAIQHAKYNQLEFDLTSFHGLNNISDQCLHRPAKVSSQS